MYYILEHFLNETSEILKRNQKEDKINEHLAESVKCLNGLPFCIE